MALTFNYDKLLMCGPLTDRRITKYVKSGYYGKDAQDRQRERDEKRNAIHKHRKTRHDLSIYDL